MAEPRARVVLKPGQDKRILAGHRWVFSNEIAKVEGDASPGALADVKASDGRAIGTAFYHPNSLIACRLISGETIEADEAFFHDRLKAAMAFREPLRPGGRHYRLCFGESDGLPGLVVDRYGSVLVLQVLSAGIERRLPQVGAALESLLKPEGVYLKNDHRARALEGLPSESKALSGTVPPQVDVEEGGLKLRTPLGDGQKTGFYFDQTDNRAFIRPYCAGRVALDLYCYTGAFGLAAAQADAKAVLGIDSSSTAIAFARDNARLNRLESVAEFEEDDAEAALASFAEGRQGFRPDLILLDPPSFVPSKKHLVKALRGYGKLNALALRALPKGGLLATSTCSHHVDRETFVGMLRLAQAKARRQARLLALRGQSADHPVLLAMPETEYLHFALLEVLD